MNIKQYKSLTYQLKIVTVELIIMQAEQRRYAPFMEAIAAYIGGVVRAKFFIESFTVPKPRFIKHKSGRQVNNSLFVDRGEFVINKNSIKRPKIKP